MSPSHLTTSQGSDIEETKPVKIAWHKHISSSFGATYAFSLDILLCGELVAPRRLNNKTVKPSCTLKADLDVSNINAIQGKDGHWYKRVDFEIEMTVIGTALDFALIVQGKRVQHGKVETEVED